MNNADWALATRFVDAKALAAAVESRSRSAGTFIQRLYLLFSGHDGTSAVNENDPLFAESCYPRYADWEDHGAPAHFPKTNPRDWLRRVPETVKAEFIHMAEDQGVTVESIIFDALSEYVLRRRRAS